jgi:hypothetical protein
MIIPLIGQRAGGGLGVEIHGRVRLLEAAREDSERDGDEA